MSNQPDTSLMIGAYLGPYEIVSAFGADAIAAPPGTSSSGTLPKSSSGSCRADER